MSTYEFGGDTTFDPLAVDSHREGISFISSLRLMVPLCVDTVSGSQGHQAGRWPWGRVQMRAGCSQPAPRPALPHRGDL